MLAEILNLTKVIISPLADTIQGISGDFNKMLTQHFKTDFWPYHKGDTFFVKTSFRPIEFKIVDCEPSDYGYLTEKN